MLFLKKVLLLRKMLLLRKVLIQDRVLLTMSMKQLLRLLPASRRMLRRRVLHQLYVIVLALTVVANLQSIILNLSPDDCMVLQVNALSVNKAPFKAPPPKPVERLRVTAPASVAPEALTRNNSTASSVEKNSVPAG